MFMILVPIYIAILLLASNGAGKLFLKPADKLYKLRAVFGFAVILFILQLGYYPMQVFQVSSVITNSWTLLILLIFMIRGLYTFRKEDLSFLKCWEFYFLIVLIFGIIKIIPGSEAGDDWFYMPWIMDNADISKINSIQPKSGWDWNINELYKYQGYYLLQSFLYYIQNALLPSIHAVFISFRVTMSLLFIIFTTMTFQGIKELMPLKNKRLVSLIVGCSILLIGYQEWSHIYWGSFAVFPIFIPLICLFFNAYCKEQKRIYVWGLMIINAAIISLFSSALFLNTFLTISFFAYNIYKKNASIKDYYYISLPLLVYFTFFIKMPALLLVLCIFALLLQADKLVTCIDYLLNRFFKYLLAALPILWILLALFMKWPFTWSLYRLGYTFLIFNIVMCGWILFMLFRKESMEPMIFAFLIFNILFFNPLVCPSVSHLLTGEHVYYRLFYITKGIALICMLFCSIAVYVQNKKIMRIGFSAGLLLLGTYYGYVLCSNTVFASDYAVAYDYTLREDKDSMDVAAFLDQQNQKQPIRYFLSQYFSPRQYNHKMKGNVYRYDITTRTDNDPINAFFQQKGEISEEIYINFKNEVQRSNYDYIIVLNQKTQDEQLRYMAKKVYQNQTYSVYKVAIE